MLLARIGHATRVIVRASRAACDGGFQNRIFLRRDLSAVPPPRRTRVGQLRAWRSYRSHYRIHVLAGGEMAIALATIQRSDRAGAS